MAEERPTLTTIRCTRLHFDGVVAFFLGCGLVPATAGGDRAFAESADAPATLVIVNAKIWAGAPDRETKSGKADQPTALAVIGNKIVAIGDDAAIRGRIGVRTKVIDAGGRRVIPGITDSHLHLIGGGFQLARLSLRKVSSKEEFIGAVGAAAKTKKKGQWVLGGRWSVESWADPKRPHRGWLDQVTGDTPVFLTRMDGHQALVNSAALALAGIDRSRPEDPEGGQIARDPQTGEPTGILKESAMDLVRDLVPEPSAHDRREALERAMRHANSLGVTSVHDMSELEDLEVFRQADSDGRLTVRVTTYLSVEEWAAHSGELSKPGREAAKIKDSMFRVAGFKGFMDGSLGSRTAYMRKPFNDARPDARYPRGQLTAMADPPESFRKMVAAADAAGAQLAVHAIGDEANHLMLNIYESVGRSGGRDKVRHRIEHAQHLHVTDIPRFASLGVVASMQPHHKADDGRYAETAIGKERLKGSYAFRQLVDAGALVCFGSDWPVVTLNPFVGIDSAVSAKTLAGDVWLKSHSLSVEEALYAYTVAPSRAIGREDSLGTLEVGKLADIVILTDDPLEMPVERIGTIKAAQTIVNGKVVFTKAE